MTTSTVHGRHGHTHVGKAQCLVICGTGGLFVSKVLYVILHNERERERERDRKRERES